MRKQRPYLDETISRAAIPEIGYGESGATLDLSNTHSEEGDGALSNLVIGGIEGGGVEVNGLDGRREEIEEEAEGDTEGEAVPELGDWVS